MYAYLIHAHAVSPLTQVLLALDTYHPTTAPAATRPDFDPALLLTQHRAVSWWRRLTADLKLLTSSDTLRDSVKTLTSQQAGEPEWCAPDGQRLGGGFFRRPRKTLRRGG